MTVLSGLLSELQSLQSRLSANQPVSLSHSTTLG